MLRVLLVEVDDIVLVVNDTGKRAHLGAVDPDRILEDLDLRERRVAKDNLTEPTVVAVRPELAGLLRGLENLALRSEVAAPRQEEAGVTTVVKLRQERRDSTVDEREVKLGDLTEVGLLGEPVNVSPAVAFAGRLLVEPGEELERREHPVLSTVKVVVVVVSDDELHVTLLAASVGKGPRPNDPNALDRRGATVHKVTDLEDTIDSVLLHASEHRHQLQRPTVNITYDSNSHDFVSLSLDNVLT